MDLKKELKTLRVEKFKDYIIVETWGIYLNNSLFEGVVIKLKELIENDPNIKGDFDYICGVPPCGIPLSASLSFFMKKPLIAPLPQDIAIMGNVERFHAQSQIQPNKKVLLVDVIINSGFSAHFTYDRLNSIQAKFVGLVVVLFNDRYPHKSEDVFKKELIDKNELKYLFKVSDLGYLFSWDEIPGNDNGLLIEFLTNKFDIDWVKIAKIEKIDNDKTIRVTAGNNFLSLRLNDEKSKANLKITDGRTDEFIAKTENGKLNIYTI